MSHFGYNRWLTHVVKERSKSRNHNKGNLITDIKQVKRKHRRSLKPGHQKCLHSVNIFAHKSSLMVALSIPTEFLSVEIAVY